MSGHEALVRHVRELVLAAVTMSRNGVEYDSSRLAFSLHSYPAALNQYFEQTGLQSQFPIADVRGVRTDAEHA